MARLKFNPGNRFNPTRLSIRQRLLLLISVLLLSVIMILGWISYVGVKKSALAAGQERLQMLTEQMSTMFSNSILTTITATRATAGQKAIKEFLKSKGKSSGPEALKLLQKLGGDSTTVLLELLDLNLNPVLTEDKNSSPINISILSALPFLSAIRPDSGKAGKIVAITDSIYYPVVATVTDSSKIIGFLVRWRLINPTQQSLDQLLKLMGTDARLFIGNDDRKLWTDLRRPVIIRQAEKQDTNKIIQYSRVKGNPVIAMIRPIPNTHWLVSIELSQQKILEAAQGFLYWIIMAGTLLLLAGIFATWVMTRTITRPLEKLITATSAIAGGNYSSLVEVDRQDELGKLADAFNAMSVQVRHSQQALEEKVQKYKLLFEKNPIPMWIISKPSLDIKDVNTAAINHYGYSRDEYLKLNSRDLRPEDEVKKHLEFVNQMPPGANKLGLWRHKKKDGTIIMVDVMMDDIIYEGEPALLVLANDITESIKIEAEMLRQHITQQKLITETTIQAQEKEREEIGRELHDNINQILAASKLHLEMAMTRTENTDSLDKSRESINLAIQEIRQLSQTLVAPSLGEIPLSGAIKDLIDNIHLASSLRIQFTAKNLNEELIDDNIKLMFYRIVQEQLNNILKHSRANNAAIELSTTSEQIILIVRDDGIGFDTSKTSGGIGLRNITNRAGLYNGMTRIHSEPGKGTTLKVTVPLKQEEEA